MQRLFIPSLPRWQLAASSQQPAASS